MRRLLTAKDFAPGEEKCLEVVRALRWSRGVRCPYCGSTSIWKAGRNPKGLQRYICRGCGKYFTDLTIFELSRLRLWEWFYLIKESQSRSLLSIARDLERPYRTVWRNAKKLKEDLLVKKLRKKLSGDVEMDETYLTAGEKGNRRLGRPPRKRGGTRRRGRGGLRQGKIPVMVLTERGGRSLFFVASEGLSQELVLKLLHEHVEKGSVVNTDHLVHLHRRDRKQRLPAQGDPKIQREEVRRGRRPHKQRREQIPLPEELVQKIQRALQKTSRVMDKLLRNPLEHEK